MANNDSSGVTKSAHFIYRLSFGDVLSAAPNSSAKLTLEQGVQKTFDDKENNVSYYLTLHGVKVNKKIYQPCEIEAELTGLIAWQRIGALCKFTNAMIEDGHSDVAFAASTNLLNAFQYNQYVDVDTNVWNVLFKPGGLDIMPPVEFINANAAASLFRMDHAADLSPYTNGIPQEILHEIIRQ